ncbi:capsule assembly Wzi family protein [Spirosoma pulveris]
MLRTPLPLLTYLLVNGWCQAQPIDSTRTWWVQAELGGWLSTAHSQPFWLQTNQSGIVPRQTPAFAWRAGIGKDYARNDTLPKRRHRFGWGFGLISVINVGNRTQVLLPEAYVKAKWGPVELLAGWRRQLIGLGDSTLSAGFVAQSDNALPIPKIQLATRGYIPLGFLRNWIAINAGYGHGWFNVPYIQASYLHQKYLYWRFGKPAAKLKIHLGLNHQVQWGGHAEYLKNQPGLAVNGQLPASMKYYPYVVFAVNPGEWSTADYTSFDGAYRIGNHVGSIDGGLEIRSGWGNWLVYHQHPYEDVSGLLWLNFPDGLTGVSWSRPASQVTHAAVTFRRIVAEYLTTLDQTGPTFDLPNSRYQGADNYYNHGQYREGWSYLGRSLGTPFIAPGVDLQLPTQGGVYFPNNRVQSWYLGAAGLLNNRLVWTIRFAFSRNFGTFSYPYSSPLNQFSGLVTTQLPLRCWAGTQLITSLALDQGRLEPNAAGGYIGLRKQW